MPAIRSQLVKWGNSQAVRIPKTVIKQARLQKATNLKFKFRKGVLRLNRRARS